MGVAMPVRAQTMPYDPGLAERLEEIFADLPGFSLKRMFGGIGWFMQGNMCVGVYKDWLIIRIGEKAARDAFKEPGVKPMDINGKPMKGWAMVAPEGYERDADLRRYVDLAIRFVRTLPAK